MDESVILDTVRTKYDLLRPLMDERMRRQWAAAEALSAPAPPDHPRPVPVRAGG